jgi:D-alanyl-D-alanine carboxypeptidase/D-alanyl-D-alanine-endopeptidase (penicillin-binding protein 4)
VVVQNRATSATSRPAMRSASTATTTPATTRASGDTIDWSREQTQNVYAITGTVSKVTKLQSKPVTDPGAFFADAVRTLFAKRGITIAGKIVRADAPPTGTMTKLAPAQTRFVDILARINKNSQNMMAEGAAKKLGREFLAMRARVTDPSKLVGSWENADTAVRDFFARNDIDATGLQFVDGSGLSRQNRVTTKLISDILLTMYRKPYFQTFKGSLGISGVEGTTRNRLKDLPNRVFCKTGYIGGVRSLSGYVLTDGGKLRVFSFIYNKIPGGGIGATRPFEDLQDEALRLLMKD